MPRIRPSAHISANISYYADLHGYSKEKLWTIMHISESTLDKRRKNPEEFRIKELQRLADSFHISIMDLFEKR